MRAARPEDLQDVRLSSRLYCRRRNSTGSTACAGRGLSPPARTSTDPGARH
ncbi:hypothetical protein FM106_24995 [Brachybacterium faecium]|nr:hypothetical protein FM106_24995 [Brachybacterium faecium]